MFNFPGSIYATSTVKVVTYVGENMVTNDNGEDPYFLAYVCAAKYHILIKHKVVVLV